MNQETYPVEFFRMLFTKNGKMEVIGAGETDFPTGEVVLADPIAYLGTHYETGLDKRIPAGSYPVELSVCHSRIAGLRIAGASRGSLPFSAWTRALPALRMPGHRKTAGYFLKNGSRKIPERINTRAVSPLYSGRALRKIRRFRTWEEIFVHGRNAMEKILRG